MERILKQNGEPANSQHTAQARFTSKSRENELAGGINGSPMMIAQRRKLQSLFGGAIQRLEANDEMLQGKFETMQRVEEEEPLQGKFEPAQRVEEEEPLQGKFEIAQRAEEEEPLQGKFEAVQRVEEEEPLQGKFAPEFPAQLKEEPAAKPNDTGLPDNLKSGIENLSGMSMDNVKVHYNSSQPAQLNALAFAQGTDIHVAPGQEQHLPHEAWHVVQQAQGRVKPTMQMKDGVPVNDDYRLEHEADVMGARAISIVGSVRGIQDVGNLGAGGPQVQQHHPAKFVAESARAHYGDGWGGKYKVTKDGELKAKVPDSVSGDGNIFLGRFYAPDSEQDPTDRRFAKDCYIGYCDGKNVSETKIYHCGPTGIKYWYDWPKKK